MRRTYPAIPQNVLANSGGDKMWGIPIAWLYHAADRDLRRAILRRMSRQASARREGRGSSQEETSLEGEA